VQYSQAESLMPSWQRQSDGSVGHRSITTVQLIQHREKREGVRVQKGSFVPESGIEYSRMDIDTCTAMYMSKVSGCTAWHYHFADDLVKYPGRGVRGMRGMRGMT